MKLRHLILAAALGTSAMSAVSAATYLNSSSSYTTVANTSLYNGTGFSFYPINYSKSVTVGGITGSSWTGHYGAKITGSVKAKLGFDASLSFTNTVGALTGGKVQTVAGNPFGAMTQGSSFVFNSSFGTATTSSYIGKGQVDAALNASAYAGANLYGKACVVWCTSGTIANLGIGKPDDIHILGYHSATNSVDFLDQHYTDALPKSFQSDVLPITAKLEAVDLSGSATGQGGNTYHTSQQFGGAYLDVAKTIVQAFGLPNDVISGSVLGVDYTTVSAKVGIGLNAIYDVTTSILDKYTNYFFSTPVQILNSITGKWSAPQTSVSMADGQTRIMRTASNVANLSIVPEVTTYGKVNANMKIDVTAEDHIRLLEASGYGLSAGPLYEHDGVVELGVLGQFSASRSFLASTTLAPLSLNFLPPNMLTADGAAMRVAGSFDGAGYSAFVFVPTPGAEMTDTISGLIQLAVNYGIVGCDAYDVSACRYDETFTGIATQQRLTRDATGAPEFSYAVDFDTVDRLQAMPDGAYGIQSTPGSIRDLLTELAGAGGYDLGPPIAFNTTPFQDAPVPEPASWLLMLAGFGLTGAALRRRRRIAATA